MTTITIRCQGMNYWDGKYWYEQKFEGFIVPSEAWDAPNTTRIKTNNARCPFSVIPNKEIISIDDEKPTFPEDTPEPQVWRMASDSSPNDFYTVTKQGEHWSCTCPHHVYRGQICKHIKRAGGFEEDVLAAFDNPPKKKE